MKAGLGRNREFYQPTLVKWRQAVLANDDREMKSEAVKSMIKMLNAGEISDAYVMVLGYSIDKESYNASALTVSPDHTLNLKETATGFACETFFPPDMLSPRAKEGKMVINGVIKVHLEVKLEDIVGIFATTREGRAVTLFEPWAESG
jgi:hypothetical protein